MTDGRPAAEVAERAAPDQLAVERYRARLRPWRIGYAALILVAALALAVAVKIAYSRGEISHAKLQTVRAAPPLVALQAPSPTLRSAWTSTDRTAIGQPYRGGTVVTYDRHAIRGRNALTGEITWSFTRTDRTLCRAIQDQGVSIAVFEVNGNCDQLTALDTDTGARKWTRTLDKDGAELNGQPSYVAVPYTVMLTTPGAIYAIDTTTGLDRWVFQHDGCTVGSAVLGAAGALISQHCTGRKCADVRFCGDGTQLLLRDPNAPENTDSATNKRNPDQIKWNLIGSELVPASAGQVVSAVSPDGSRLVVLGAAHGERLGSLPLAERSTRVASSAAADADLVRIGATTYALAAPGATFVWTSRTRGVPTVTGKSGVGTPSLSKALLTVPVPGGIARLDPGTGAVKRLFAVPTVLTGSRIYPFGPGFLVAGTRTVYYR